MRAPFLMNRDSSIGIIGAVYCHSLLLEGPSSPYTITKFLNFNAAYNSEGLLSEPIFHPDRHISKLVLSRDFLSIPRLNTPPW